MISIVFVLAAILASPTIASPIPVASHLQASKRSPLKLGGPGGGIGGGILGGVLDGGIVAAGSVGAQALQDGTEEQLASAQLAAETSLAAAQAAQPTATPVAKRSPSKVGGSGGLGGGLGGGILGGILNGGIVAAGNVGAQALQDGTEKQLASAQLAAETSLAAAQAAQATATPVAKRSPLKLGGSGGGLGGSILGGVLDGGLVAAGNVGAQALQDGTEEQLASAQLAAETSLAVAQAAQPTATSVAKRSPSKVGGSGGGLGGGLGGGILGGILNGGIVAAGNVGAQALQDGTEEQLASAQLAAETSLAAVQAAQATATPVAKRSPLKLGGSGGGLGGSILGGVLDSGITAAGNVGVQALQGSTEKQLANDKIAAEMSLAASQATATPVAKRSPLKLGGLGGGLGGNILGGVLDGGLTAAGSAGAQALQDGTEKQLASAQLAAETSLAAAQATQTPAKRYVLDELD